MQKQSILYLLTVTILFASCSDGGNDPGPISQNSTIYVTNEGSFRNTVGTITSFDAETGTATQKALSKANNREGLTGTVLQSGVINQDKLYLSLNEADMIEVVNAQSLTRIATIPLSTSVTSVQVINDSTAYATNLYNSVSVDSVSIIDLANMKATDQRIPVGNQPRDMVKVGNLVYVANTGGFSGSSKTISVIDANTNTVKKTIDVGVAPTKLIVDRANQIWVVCQGIVPFSDETEEVPGSVYVLDGESVTVVDQFSVDGHPGDLALDEKNGRGYLLDNAVKIINLNTKEIIETLVETQQTGAIFYSAHEELIYLSKRPQVDPYTQPGRVVRYNLSGAAVDSFQTGIAPNGFLPVND